MIFRGEFTEQEKTELISGIPDDWIVTKNHLGFWARSHNWEMWENDPELKEYLEIEKKHKEDSKGK